MSAEAIKVESDYLAGTIAEELTDGSASFEHDAELLLKFHGIYQQDDRDVRRARTQQRLPVDYSCMVRASVPGGVISADQWIALDRLAGLANDRLRLTTRQGVQYHVVYKDELRELVAGINDSLLTTLGACGDVVRNVMACPLPHPERRVVIDPIVAGIVARFRPRTESYWELWVDGERAVSAERPDATAPSAHAALDPIDDVEPIYGAAYLPRKFKIGIAWPGDNCVDVFTHDVGIVPTLERGTHGELTGFVVLAGGGMGMSHNRPDDTYPLLAQPVAWARPADVVDVVEAIVTTQRDHGDREDRSRARLKYLVEAKGVDWLRTEVESRIGRTLEPPVELPDWQVEAHHGRHDHESSHGHDRDTVTLGLPVPSGTVTGGLRRALARLVTDGLVTELRVTPRQDLLLLGIDHAHVDTVEHLLRANGVALAADNSPTRNLAIACPALPTCSKALGEAERMLPEVIDRLEKLLAETGNAELALRLNMTGCPNGCSRPYAAELGIVGRSKRTYDIYVGGSPAGDRLARRLRADVLLDDVPDLLRPLLERFSRTTSDDAVSFGDWAWEQGQHELEQLLPRDTSRRARRARGERADATTSEGGRP
ncbi:MAG: NADPH-dependent assimilatory sulfite reductase hemoprotein subunit [Actinomycetota bacterium]